MAFDLSEKIALVTGGARGIGKGCALELAKAGATVVLNDRQESPDLLQTQQEINGLGADCLTVEGDIFSRNGCEQVVSAALRKTERVDILISNPAYSRRCDFLEYDPEEFEQTLAGTLTSGFHMSQLVARHLVKRNSPGKLVFISSVQAEMPIALSVAYGAAKAGLNHLVRTVAVELAAHRINANAIEPGWIDTPGERLAFGEEAIDREGKHLPWGRLGTPADIGKAAAFLSSENADYITGSILAVDGGFRYKDCRSQTLIQTRPQADE